MANPNEGRKPLTAANAMYHLTKNVFIGESTSTLVGISHMKDGKYDPKVIMATTMNTDGTLTEHDMTDPATKLEIPAKKFEIPKKAKPAAGETKEAAVKKAAPKKAAAKK